MTARTGPPAITPVPSGAGFSRTRPLPKRPRTGCRMVVSSTLTLRKFFFAASMPFLMAEGTSFALPVPKPTTLAPGSPTTTSAEKLIFLPPLTTLVTRLMLTTCSFRFRFCVSTRLALPFTAIRLKLQTRLAGRIGERLHAPVVLITAAIENHFRDALLFGALGHLLADQLRAFDVAALAAQILFGRGGGRERV